ncbi:MAG: rhomboid family intramembrane serine protease [Desulfobulbaceae bacterium]|jgi:membrane associated rhomboid family serine protease|nr:rhomboid family intramembrane serine protease [Desulfobulbaceae bacterium]
MPEAEKSGAARPDQAVFTSRDREEINLASLTLSAFGIGHRVFWRDGWRITVSASDAAKAREEIVACLRENAITPVAEFPFTPIFRAMHLAACGGLCLMYAMSGPWQEHSPLFTAASAQALAITHGEWRRAVTALCLHADSAHLLSNVGIGLLLLYFYFHSLGNGLGLLALITSAAAANLASAFLHGAGHDSVGFSTALFAAIGILSSFRPQRRLWRRFDRWMPLAVGGALLAMLGSEGQRTDFGAHICGLVMGLATGYVLSWRKIASLRQSLFAQTLFFCLAMAALWICWQLALG